MNPEQYAGKTILFIVPHADDLHYQAGGTAALWARAGARVVSLALTDSACGTRNRDANYDRMVAEGEAEALRAGAVTGLEDTRFFRFPDGFLVGIPYIELREKLVELIRQYQPYVVVTWDPFNPYEVHPDHRHAAPAVYDAVQFADYPLFHRQQIQRGLAPTAVPEVWLLSNRPQHLNEFVDIGPVLDVKINALLAYRTAMHLAVDDLRRPLEVADPGSPFIPKLRPERYAEIMAAFVREKARAVGEAAGFAYAEAFRVVRFGAPEPDGFRRWLETWSPDGA